jgi:Tfp pilus assembly protein PilN
VKATLNLAARHNQARHLAATIARRLLPLLGCWLLYLLISQGLIMHRQQSLKKELARLVARVRVDEPPVPRNISAEEIKRQEEELAFINGLVAKDNFAWTELLGRLEKAMTQGITLTGIEPNYQEGSLRIAGLAEDVSALRGYLTSLLNSDSLAAAYLLQQETRMVKDQQDGEHAVVAFRIEIQKAFR